MPLLLVCRHCGQLSTSPCWWNSRISCEQCAASYGAGSQVHPCVVTSSIAGTGHTHHLLLVCPDSQDKIVILRTDTPDRFPFAAELGRCAAVDTTDIDRLVKEQQLSTARAVHALKRGVKATAVHKLMFDEMDDTLREVGLGNSPDTAVFEGKSLFLCPLRIVAPQLAFTKEFDHMRRIRSVNSPLDEIVLLLSRRFKPPGSTEYDVMCMLVYRDGQSKHASLVELFMGCFFEFEFMVSCRIRQIFEVTIEQTIEVSDEILASMSPVHMEMSHDADVVVVQTPVFWLLLTDNTAQIVFVQRPSSPIGLMLTTATGIVLMMTFCDELSQVLWSDTPIDKLGAIKDITIAPTIGLDSAILMPHYSPIISIPQLPAL